MQAGRRQYSTSTGMLWQPKECTSYKKTGTDSSQRTKKDKRTMDPGCKRAKGKLLLGVREKNSPFTKRAVTHWNKLLCYEISILGATRDSLGKGPSNLNWLLSCIELQSQLRFDWAWTKQLPVVPSSLNNWMIWSQLSTRHSGFHGLEIDKGSLHCGKQSHLFCSRQLKQGLRLKKAEVDAAAHPKFFFLFNVCFILYYLKEREHALKSQILLL